MGTGDGSKGTSGPPKKLTDKQRIEQVKDEVAAKLDPIKSELDSMVGAKKMKAQVAAIIDQETINIARRTLNLPVDDSAIKRTFVIEGNPGTGKSRVAAVLAKVLAATGVTTKPEIIETSGGALIKGYVGQSGEAMQELLKKGKGGTIFIDEAQQIAQNDLGKEVVSAITAFTENNPDTAIILSGYSKKANPTNNIEQLFEKDPGFARRFSDRITMENYTPEERIQILADTAGTGKVPAKLKLTPDQMAEVVMNPAIDWDMQNAGGVVNALKQAKRSAASRAVRTHNPRAQEELLPEDFGLKPSKV